MRMYTRLKSNLISDSLWPSARGRIGSSDVTIGASQGYAIAHIDPVTRRHIDFKPDGRWFLDTGAGDDRPLFLWVSENFDQVGDEIVDVQRCNSNRFCDNQQLSVTA